MTQYYSTEAGVPRERCFGYDFSYSRSEKGPKPGDLVREVHVDDELGREGFHYPDAATSPPADYVRQMGWVLIAFQNALWQMLHANSLEEAVVDTVMRGGDTDTNAAICGALMGAIHGRDAIPRRWEETVLACRPEAGTPGIHRPRPREYWMIDALDVAGKLVGV